MPSRPCIILCLCTPSETSTASDSSNKLVDSIDVTNAYDNQPKYDSLNNKGSQQPRHLWAADDMFEDNHATGRLDSPNFNDNGNQDFSGGSNQYFNDQNRDQGSGNNTNSDSQSSDKEDDSCEEFNGIAIDKADIYVKEKLPPFTRTEHANCKDLLQKVHYLGCSHHSISTNPVSQWQMAHIATLLCCSTSLQNTYARQCQQAQLPFIKPRCPVLTQWNSTAIMIQSFVPYCWVVNETVNQSPELWSSEISDAEWEVAEKMLPVLQVIFLLFFSFLYHLTTISSLTPNPPGIS